MHSFLWLISRYCKISRRQARRIIDNSKKHQSAVDLYIKTIGGTSSIISQNNMVLKDLLDKYRTIMREYERVAAASGPLKTPESSRAVNNGTALLVPFKNADAKSESWEYVSHYIEKHFKNKNINVICPDLSSHTGAELNIDDYAAIAKKYDARYVISGRIGRYDRHKKFVPAGVLIDVAFFGFNNRANVTLSSSVFDASKNSVVFTGSVERSKKRQIFGLFRGNGGVMSYAVKEAVDKLYENMKL